MLWDSPTLCAPWPQVAVGRPTPNFAKFDTSTLAAEPWALSDHHGARLWATLHAIPTTASHLSSVCCCPWPPPKHRKAPLPPLLLGLRAPAPKGGSSSGERRSPPLLRPPHRSNRTCARPPAAASCNALLATAAAVAPAGGLGVQQRLQLLLITLPGGKAQLQAVAVGWPGGGQAALDVLVH